MNEGDSFSRSCRRQSDSSVAWRYHRVDTGSVGAAQTGAEIVRVLKTIENKNEGIGRSLVNDLKQVVLRIHGYRQTQKTVPVSAL